MTAVRPRLRLLVVGVTIVGAIGVLAASGLGESLVYYRTPTEVVEGAQAQPGRIRLGGLVEAGSVTPTDDGVRFVLTDGVSAVEVLHRGDPPGVFQEGQGALVEGSLDGDGRLQSDLLIVKHSNEYRGEDGSDYRGEGGEPYQVPGSLERP